MNKPLQMKSRPSLSGLERLSALGDWTTEPARIASNAVAATESPAPIEEPAAPPETVEVAEVAPTQTKKKAGKGAATPEMPWVGESDDKTQMSVFIPKSLLVKVKYLATTTYGDNIREFTIRALNAEAKRILKERGISDDH